MRRRVRPLSSLLAALTLCTIASTSLHAQCPGVLSEWQYRVPITVTNNGGPLTNYLLFVTFNTQTPVGESKMRADGGDVRFADADCAVMNYWVQDGMNGSETHFWVKVPSLPSGESTVYLYYGNPAGTHSNQVADVFGNGLVSLFTFTEGEGNVLHDWVGGFNLDVTCTWGPGFREGVGALTGFSRSNRAFMNGNGPALGTGSFTVIDYIRPSDVSGNTQGIFGNYNNDGANGWTHKLQGGSGQFMLLSNQGGNWCQQSVGSLQANQWQMSGVRRQSSVADHGLQNGAVTGGAFCNGDNRNVDGSGPYEIGNSYNNSYPFNGSISISMVYNVALSDQEVAAIHNSLRADPEPTPAIGPEETVEPPVITQHPVGDVLCPGEAITFSVEATGPAVFTYQWRRNGQPILGATEQTYTIDPVRVSDGGSYDVVVNRVAISNPAVLVVNQPADIISHPAGTIVCPGAPLSFSVTATGTDINFQWRKNGDDIPGATSSQYVIPSASESDSGSYDVVVTGICGDPAVSEAADVTVRVAPAIISVTGNQTVCRGQIAMFSVEAVGEGLTYQWRKDGKDIEGATKPTLSIMAQPYSAGYYDVVITGACEPTLTSTPAQLTVNLDPIITEQPISRTVNLGSSITFKVSVIGGGILSYQWQKDGINIPGATTNTLTINNITVADIGEYSVVVRGTICGEFEPTLSDKASLILNIPPTIVKHPENAVACEGSDVTLSVTAGGLGLNYQWRKNGTPIPGATGRDLVIEDATADAAASYDVVITGTGAPTPLTSNAATVTVNTAATLTTQPQDVTVCSGDPASFTVAVNGSGVTYQWQKNGVDINGEENATLSIANATEADTGTYSVIINANCTEQMTSTMARLVLNTKPAITAQPAPTINAPLNGTVVLTVTALGSNLTYQWRKDGAPIPGATTATYTINNAQPGQSGNYDVIVSGACEPAVTSDVAVVTVATSSVPNYDVTTGAMLTVVPHPATGMTRMTVRLPQGVHAGSGASLMLYDGTGKAVLDLSAAFERGSYQTVEFNASELTSGVYYCKLSTGTFTATLGSIVVAK